MEYVYIKNVKIAKTAALAPMADVADGAFRTVAKKYGAAYTVGEMVSAKGLVYGDKKTAALLKTADFESGFERPRAVQLFGSEPEFMAKAAVIAAGERPDIIDVNAGCPVAKVVKTGAGSALLKPENAKLFGGIINAVVSAVDIPVTVKIRSGWDENSINAVETAKIAEYYGALAVAVHGRTKRQAYSGTADWGVIAAVKKAVNIPVIGNGDVDGAEKCVQMYERTGCDLVMVGRAARGRPWIFRDIARYVETGEPPSALDLTEILAVMREHIELIVRDKGESAGMREARKQAAWYLKGIRNAAGYREKCARLVSLKDFYELAGRILADAGS
ncbi:MAG: tRNA dihydrouridine synthase DusB [Oscillospiraceae bacterium]|jgi:tRNA-dihydrouridine synthase B|nr:tRNA dihydrouridine synthase DusB [Oscillospiraceae bacterium]